MAKQQNKAEPIEPRATPSSVVVDGCDVQFNKYAAPGRPSVILVHCGGGHSGWWTAVLPELTGLEIITIDLSGHGQSGHRDAYTPVQWAAELKAVASEASNSPPVLVGHSMGGLASIYCAALFPQVVGGLILIDPPVEKVFIRDLPRNARVYDTIDAAMSRFKLAPPETIADPALLHTVGRIGLKPVEGGWSWRYDTLASQRFSAADLDDKLALVRCPVGCIYGGESQYVDAGTVRHIEQLLQRPVRAEVIPQAFHHIPLDCPGPLAAAIVRMHSGLSTAGSV